MSDDLVAPTAIPSSDWWGGALKEAAQDEFTGPDREARFAEFFSQTGDPIPTPFSEETLVDLYRMEGFAYEYWRTTALLRTLGKGGELFVGAKGPRIQRTDEFNTLIESYDARLERERISASTLGVAFPQDPEDRFTALIPYYNVEHLPPAFPEWNTPFEASEASTNFLVAPVPIGPFLERHRFAASAFEDARGFRLSSFCGVLTTISWVDFYNRFTDGRLDTGRAYHLWQRGYALAPREFIEQALPQWALVLMGKWRPDEANYIPADAPAVIEYLTLTPTRQAKIGLWTRGPLCPLVPYGEQYLVDLSVIGHRLRTEFVGIRFDGKAKGPEFEDVFRQQVDENGLQLLPERHLQAHEGDPREVDAAIRVGTTLVLCECIAAERPLDFELGRLTTISKRNEILDEKVEQALTLAQYVKAKPRGRNYDYTWATEVLTLVVSPFVEWVWTSDARLWADNGVPRILETDEAIRYITSLAAKKVVGAEAASPA